MLHATKPIFELLYAFIRENFLIEEASDGMLDGEKLLFYPDEASRPPQTDRFLNQFYRGPPLALGGSGTPAAWMRFGQITEAEFDRAPEGYRYDLSYLLDVIVTSEHIPSGSDSRDVFTSFDDPSLALGEIVSGIVQKAWDELHTGFLTKGNFEIVNGDIQERGLGQSPGQFPLSENNWWVKAWTFSVNGEIADTVSEWRDVIHSFRQANRDTPYRDATINFKFTVFEEEPLIC